MAKNLIIVESPAKIKTLSKFLGKDYKIQASMGHIRDLPKSTLGVDCDNNFEPKYINVRGKAKLIKKLKEDAKRAKNIFLATDPDREGEAISWHLAYLLDIPEDKAVRITFNEITKGAVKDALLAPRPIDMDLVSAQQGRRILDRIVGYKISPLLWKKVKKGLSAGRVQSATTRFVCDREDEINAFIAEEYWNLSVDLKKFTDQKVFNAKYYGLKSKKILLKCKEDVENVLADIEGGTYKVLDVKESEKKKHAPPPFITSTLQQEAARKLNFPTRKTMMIAQQLYEGIALGKGDQIGLITYMRTDSVRISEEHRARAKDYIEQKYGSAYVGSGYFSQKKKGVAAQDAHEAIRPSDVVLHPDNISKYLTRDQFRLYKLIWERFVASQMSNALFDAVVAMIEVSNHRFRAQGEKLTFKGYTAVYTEGIDIKESDDGEKAVKAAPIPPLVAGDILEFVEKKFEQKFTKPPSRYTEATLVKALEEEGIGRPSTYAPTIGTILNRGYVAREKKFLYPTELGVIVNDIMKTNFSDIISYKFTAQMEAKLDDVEDGRNDWVTIIAEFYKPFMDDLKKAEEVIEKIKLKDEETDVICDKCGRNMVIKLGRFGKFLACPGFPECRNAKPITVDAGVLCPLCKAPVLIKKTKKRKDYLGCSNNPTCEFMAWDLPSGELCQKCGNFLHKKFKGKDQINYCSNKDCDYQSIKPRKSAKKD